MIYNFNHEKNVQLKRERNICFEDVIAAIEEDALLDIIKHPKSDVYPHQKIYIIKMF
ncbi:MAG: hypothetical protein ACQESH_06270 [Campylobacterota bacterium]